MIAMRGRDLTDSALCGRIRDAELHVHGDRVTVHYVDRFGAPRTARLCYANVAAMLVEWRQVNTDIVIPIGTIEIESDGQGGYYLKIPLPDDWEP